MNAARITRIVLTVAACLLVAGCRTTTSQRQVTGRVFLDRGTVACNSRRAIWESISRTRGCDVTVTYRGNASCQARLVPLKQNSVGNLERAYASATEPAGAEEITVRLHDVQAVWLVSGDPRSKTNSGESSYVVERVNSSSNVRILDTATLPGATLTNVVALRGGPQQPVWESPLPQGASDRRCDVTVRVRSLGRGRAVLHYQLESGIKRVQSVDGHSELVTLQNVTKVGVSCEGLRGGRCSVEVMQVDCPQ